MPVSEGKLIRLSSFPRGTNNMAPETDIPEGAFREGVNIDLTKEGKPRRRKGFAKRYSGANCHSLAGFTGKAVFMDSGVLSLFNSDFTATALGSGYAEDRIVSYCEVNGDIYLTNGAVTGKIENNLLKEWGIPDPNGQPLLSVGAGSMPAGTYQVAITHIDGEESGSTLASVITLVENQGIILNSIPQPASGNIRTYITPPNGEVFYLQAEIPVGLLSLNITGFKQDAITLNTQFMKRVPPGQIIRYYNGRIWIASGKTLWHTDALRYGLHKPSTDYFMFPSRITMLEPMQDGIYVGADKTYFLAGPEPKAMGLLVAHADSPLEGSGSSVPAKAMDIDEVPGDAAVWFADSGIMAGLPGGVVMPLMDDRVAVDKYTSGTALFREEDGIRQLIMAVKGKTAPTKLGATDSAVATVIRNGITI